MVTTRITAEKIAKRRGVKLRIIDKKMFPMYQIENKCVNKCKFLIKKIYEHCVIGFYLGDKLPDERDCRRNIGFLEIDCKVFYYYVGIYMPIGYNKNVVYLLNYTNEIINIKR